MIWCKFRTEIIGESIWKKSWIQANPLPIVHKNRSEKKLGHLCDKTGIEILGEGALEFEYDGYVPTVKRKQDSV